MEHGTNNSYVNGGCRCDECKRGHREYVSAERKRKKKERLQPLVDLAISTLGGKCSVCGTGDSSEFPLVFCAIRDQDVGESVRSMIYKGSDWFSIGEQLGKCELICTWCREKRGARFGKEPR